MPTPHAPRSSVTSPPARRSLPTSCLRWTLPLLVPFSLSAQTSLYWDVNSTTAGAGGASPSGNWRTSGSGQNWGNLADGTANTGYWVNDSIAVFSAGNDATGSFTVTVNNVTADSIIIEEGNITFNSSTITLSGDIPGVQVAAGLTATFSSRISGEDFHKTGDGVVVFQGSSKNYSGITYVDAGVLRLGSAGMIGNTSNLVIASGATFDLNGYVDTIGSLAGSGSVSLGGATLTIDGDGETTEFSGIISGAGGIAKTGTDTLILSGANTYAGLTTVSAGVLNIRHSQALGSTAAGTTVTSGEELQLQGNITVGAESLSITGTGAGSTGALRNISGDNVWGGLVTLTGTSQITVDSGSLDLSGGVAGSNTALTLTGAGDLTISGVALGSGALNKRNTGTLTLSGPNSSTGAMTIGTSGGAATGTVRLDSDDALSSGTLTLYAGTLDLDGNSATTGALVLGGGVAGSSVSIVTDDGVLTLGGNVTYSATNNTNGATISGYLDLGSANRTFNIGNSSATTEDVVIDAIMSGTGGLNKATGTGTLVLSGANTYTGATTVGAGVLNIRHSQALGSTDTGTTVTSGDELQLQGGIAIGAETLSITGTGVSSNGALHSVSGDNSWAGAVTLTGNALINASADSLSLTGGISGTNRTLTLAGDGNVSVASITTGSGGLIKSGAGTATLTGTSTYTGSTAVNSGTLQLGADDSASTSSALSVASGATFSLNGFDGSVATIAGAGTIHLDGGTLSTAGTGTTTFSGSMIGDGGFTKGGSGTLTLTGTNSYTGNTDVSAGILRIGANNSLGAATAVTVATGATFDVNDRTQAVATIAGAGAIDLGSGALSTTGTGSTTYSGTMSGTGTFTKAGSGTLTLSGTNTYTGATTIQEGTLQLGASNVLANGTAVTVSSGAVLDLGGFSETVATLAGAGTVQFDGGSLTVAGSGSTTFSGDFTGDGTFTKQGAGVLTLDHDLGFDGTFNLAGGTLRLSNVDLHLGTLNITGTSIIDFAGVSSLNISQFSISGGVSLTIQNWADASDYFFAQFWSGASHATTGSAPMNQITFTGFSPGDTKWLEYDNQISPVPEPGTYGVLLLAAATGAIAWRRRTIRRRRLSPRPH